MQLTYANLHPEQQKPAIKFANDLMTFFIIWRSHDNQLILRTLKIILRQNLMSTYDNFCESTNDVIWKSYAVGWSYDLS